MDLARRTVLGGALAAPFVVSAAPAAAANFEERCTTDFADLGRYRADNARLIASGAPVDVVFLGDSITEGWTLTRPSFFSPGRVGRGISGQTTSQMVLRMMADVVALKPRALHFMAGTNDVAGNTGPMTEQMTRDNVTMVADIARAHGIRLMLASIPPAGSFPWLPDIETLAPIASLNRWIRAFAAERRATYIDYHSAMADGTGAMKPGFANDGVHPTAAGYAMMENVVSPALARLTR